MAHVSAGKLKLTSFVLLILLTVFTFGQKPVISVDVQLDEQSFKKIAESVVFDEVYESRKFKVLLQDALSELSKELVLQDLFSNQNIVLSNAQTVDGQLTVVISNFDLYTTQTSNEYIENPVSGDYILTANGYVRIFVGERYRYDSSSSRYVQDSDGTYVRGYDGKYYSAYTFYSFIPHTKVYYILKARVDYSLSAKDLKKASSFDISTQVAARDYIYDPYNNRMLSVQESKNKLFDYFSTALAQKVQEELMATYKITGYVESVKFPRTILDVGDKDGVKVGGTFKIFTQDQKAELSELTVIRTGGDYSECEITYVKKGYNVKPNDVAVESNATFILPLSFSISYRMDNTFNFDTSEVSLMIGLKKIDIHRDITSYLNFGAAFLAKDLTNSSGSDSLQPTFEVSGGFRLFGNGFSVYGLGMARLDDAAYVGLGLKIGILNIEAFSTLSFDKFLFGGGLLW